MDVFVDSDVVVSSLISHTGAAYLLLTQSLIKPIITTLSLQELQRVVVRLNIAPQLLEELVRTHCTVITLEEPMEDLQKQYEHYVFDPFDAHIVAGAKRADVRFLISYNLKHFNIDKIKEDLDIRVMTPGTFLQYLRSQ